VEKMFPKHHYNRIFILIGYFNENDYVQNNQKTQVHPAPLRFLMSVASLRLQSAG